MNHESGATWICREATEWWARSLSNSSLGSHLSYESLKTIVGQVEQLVQRITNEAEAELKDGRSSVVQMQQQRSSSSVGDDVTSTSQSRAAAVWRLQEDITVQQQRERFQHKGLM